MIYRAGEVETNEGGSAGVVITELQRPKLQWGALPIAKAVQERVVILGCIRSGTSLLAGSLREQGLFLGDNLMPGNKAFPKGCLEDKNIFDISTYAIIAGGSDDAIQAPAKTTIDLGEEWTDYVARLSGIKVPLMMWSFESWVPALGDFKIIAVRRGRSASLRSLSDFGIARPEKIYEAYNERLDEIMGLHSGIEVCLEDFIKDVSGTMERLCAYAGLQYDGRVTFYESEILKYKG